jgi:hypothetical protein
MRKGDTIFMLGRNLKAKRSVKMLKIKVGYYLKKKDQYKTMKQHKNNCIVYNNLPLSSASLPIVLPSSSFPA